MVVAQRKVQEVIKKSLDGHPFKVWWECVSCGAEIKTSDRYCRMCGVELTE